MIKINDEMYREYVRAYEIYEKREVNSVAFRDIRDGIKMRSMKELQEVFEKKT